MTTLSDPVLDDLFEQLLAAAIEFGHQEQHYNVWTKSNHNSTQATEYRRLERARLSLDRVKFDFIQRFNTPHTP